MIMTQILKHLTYIENMLERQYDNFASQLRTNSSKCVYYALSMKISINTY